MNSKREEFSLGKNRSLVEISIVRARSSKKDWASGLHPNCIVVLLGIWLESQTLKIKGFKNMKRL